jgi:hypothetical protein
MSSGRCRAGRAETSFRRTTLPAPTSLVPANNEVATVVGVDEFGEARGGCRADTLSGLP